MSKVCYAGTDARKYNLEKTGQVGGLIDSGSCPCKTHFSSTVSLRLSGQTMSLARKQICSRSYFQKMDKVGCKMSDGIFSCSVFLLEQDLCLRFRHETDRLTD